MNDLVRGVSVVMSVLAAAPPALAQPDWHSVAVPATAFEIAGVDPADDRSQLLLRVIRVVHSIPEGVAVSDRLRERLGTALDDIDGTKSEKRTAVPLNTPTLDLPLPMAPKMWASVVFGRPVPPRALFSAIIRDRHASLLYYGLIVTPPGTRTLLESTPDLLRWVYRERAAAFAAFGGSFRVAGGRVEVPGGEDARTLWESLVGEPVGRPAAFFKSVFGRDAGRFAYFYDAMAQLEGPRQQFALGAAGTDPSRRVERMRALYRAFADIDGEWSLRELPFARPMFDAATLLRVVRVTSDGRLAPPAIGRLWQMAFEDADIPGEPARAVRDIRMSEVLDAAGLADLVVLGPARSRRERFERFAFGQRVFAALAPPELGDVLVALRGYARYPALMLVLERLGVAAPAALASFVARAREIERVGDPIHQTPLLAQFQGTLALVDRLARTGRLDPSATRDVLASLATIAPDGSAGYRGRLAAWVEASLQPSLGPNGNGSSHEEPTVEHTIVTGLADREPERGVPFHWEGLPYIVGIGESETERIEAVRAKQGGNTLDAMLAFSRDVRALTTPDLSLARVKAVATALKGHASALEPARAWPGIEEDAVPDVPSVIARAVEDLEKIGKPGDLARAERIAEPLVRAADYLLGEVLIALAYAPLLGDPADMLGGEADLSHRHDFGLVTTATADQRQRAPWLRPRSAAGSGPSIVGALLGLDLVLARHSLRRLVADRVPEVPRLNLNDRDTYTVTAALANPRALTDADMAQLVAALKTGRERVAAAGADPASLDALAAAARMSSGRRHLIPWTAAHDRVRVANLFSLAELFELGRQKAAFVNLDAFGLTAEPLTGCFCTRFPEPGPWENYSGRPGTGQLATRVPDLTLRVAELLDELKVPAILLPAVLARATQDFIDEVDSTHMDDWAAAVARARALSRERVEDYIAALTAGGPLRPQVQPNQR